MKHWVGFVWALSLFVFVTWGLIEAIPHPAGIAGMACFWLNVSFEVGKKVQREEL